MNILALDTAFDVCSVALQQGQHCLQKFESEPRKQAQCLLPMVDELLLQAQLKLTELDFIALSIGPGSFVGLRIGAALAQAFAYAANLPTVAISSLQLYAQTAFKQHQIEQALVAINAHMGEVYCGHYQLDDEQLMQPLTVDTLLKPEPLAEKVQTGESVIGNAWEVYQDEIGLSSESIITVKPRAEDLIELAIPLFKNNKTLTASQIQPRYLRGEEAWRS